MGQLLNTITNRKITRIVLYAVIASALYINCSSNSGDPNQSGTDNSSSTSPVVYVNPTYASVAPNGTDTLTATGGTPPYTFSIATGAGSVRSTSGVTATFNAPAATGVTEIKAVDAAGSPGYVSVEITTTGGNVGGLVVSPMDPTVGISGTVNFAISGGTPPYSYAVNTNNGGTFSGSLFTAPSQSMTVTTTFTDSVGNSVVNTITVGGNGSTLLCNGTFPITVGGNTNNSITFTEDAATGVINGSVTVNGSTSAISNGSCSSSAISFVRVSNSQIWSATLLYQNNETYFLNGTISGTNTGWSGNGTPTP